LEVSLTAPIPALADIRTGLAVDTLDVAEPLVDLAEHSGGSVICDAAYRKGGRGAPDRCYVRLGVAERLLWALALLPSGVRFVVFDSWRPLDLQRRLFDDQVAQLLLQHPEWTAEAARAQAALFVADPDASTPPHCTGGAVDLGLAARDGTPLEFGTEFDDFSPRSATRYFEDALDAGRILSASEEEALRDRRMLFHALAAAGFTNYPAEWWHFDYGDAFWAQAVGGPALYGPAGSPGSA
jgi:D-alanyl-D-alanine dipeptidase